MVSDGDQGGPTRRDFLTAGGAGALTLALAGCDELPEEGERTDDGSGNESDGNAGTGTPGGDGEDGDGGTEGAYVADVAAIDREVAAESGDLARAAFSEEYYQRVEGAATGVDAPEGTTPVGHAVTYGHRTTVAGEEAPEVPTLRKLSAGTFTVPAPEGGEGAGVFASAPLSEIVASGDGPNPFLAAAGLGGTVEWLEGPVSMDRREVEYLEGTGVAETFVGVLSAEPGPGIPASEDDGFLDDEGVQTPLFAAVHTSRTTMGSTVVMAGMVEGWRRPPTMGPGETGIGEDLQDLLAEAYQAAVQAELFERSLGGLSVEVASALPGPDERPPPPEDEVREPDAGPAIGLDDNDQIELGYPTETVETDRASTSFTVGRDVPGLFSGEEFDEEEHSRGTRYYVKPQYRAAVYPVDGENSVPFGAVVSPKVEIEGQERNPLLTEPVTDLVGEYDDLNSLFSWLGEYRSYSWHNQPSVFETLSNPDLLRNSTELKGVSEAFSAQTTDGDQVGRDDAAAYVARTETGSQAALAVAFSVESGDGFFGRTEATKRLFRQGVRRTGRSPTTPNTFVGGSIDDLNLVQICRNTRVETGGGDVLGQPDPDLVEGRFTGAPFDVSTFSGTARAGDTLQYGVFTLDAANRSSIVGETILGRNDVDALDTDSTDPDALFDANRQDGNDDTDVPVFELQGSDDSLTLEFRAPSGLSYDTTTVSEGSDYTTTPLEFLRVGFITVSDPEDGANYGDGDGGPADYEETVDAAFEFLKRTFPGGVAAYRHDGAIEGVKNIDGTASANETKDYRNARVALERIAKPGNNNWSYSGTTMAHKTSESDARSQIRSNGFDVWVMIAPTRYYQFHRAQRPTGLAPGPNDLAVAAVEGARYGGEGRPDAAETVAQEIAHRLGDDQYRNPTSGAGMQNPLAQRDPGGSDAGNRDFDHARHLSSDNDNDGTTPRDQPGVVSRAYSLAEGEFVVPTGHEWSGGYQVEDVTSNPTLSSGYGPTNSAQRLGRMESYMSYSDRWVWTDSVITQDIIDGNLNRDPGNFRTANVVFGGLNEVSADAGGDGAEDPSPSVSDLEVAEATVSPSDEGDSTGDATVEVALLDPDGERVATTTVAAQTAVDGHGVEENTLDGDATFDVEFPPEAVEMTVAAETGQITENPITRALREAYDRIPPEGLSGEPAAVRDRVAELLASVDAAMAERQFAAARDELAAFAERELAGTVDPEFEPAANEYDEARLRALFGEMIGRLDGLASDDTGAGEIEVGEAPAWTEWVPEPAALPGFADSRGLWQYDVGSALAAEDLQARSALTDPMANPFFAGYLGVTTWEQLRALGLGEAVLGGAADGTGADPSEVPAETVVLVGNVQLYLGSFDTERLDAVVEEDVVAESDRPGIFLHTEADFAFAYGADYVVGAPSVDEVATMLETGAGERTRWHEAEPEVEWLYGAGARGDYTLVNHFSEGTIQPTGGGINLSPFLSANGVAQSASTDGATFTDATTALVYPSEDAVELAALEETLAPEAADRTVAQDGRFVQVRATYVE